MNPRSWVASANGHGDFPLHNLPLGVFSRPGETPRGGVAIGDQVLDLRAAVAAGVFQGDALAAAQAASGSTLNAFFALGSPPRQALRAALLELLSEHSGEQARLAPAL